MNARVPSSDGRHRIAVIGGGLAGLTAAWELSKTPELRDRYRVTVYTMGHRLGGKLASGRNPEEGWRNEEHGLHVWFGFYDNTFALADEVLRRWRKPEGCRLQTVWDLVRPHHVAMYAEPMADGHRVHQLHLPRTGRGPGSGRVLPGPLAGLSGLVDLLRVIPRNVLDLAGVDPRRPRGVPDGVKARVWRPVDRAHARLVKLMDRPLQRVADGLVALAATGTPERRLAHAERLVVRLDGLIANLKGVRAWLPEGVRAVQAVHSLELLVCSIRGLLDPEVGIVVDGDLDRISDQELTAWLRSQGASEEALRDSVVLRGVYDAFFQYTDGDRDQPCFEAGTAVRICLRALFGYHGAVAWLLTTGMGEGLIAPLYEVLRDQGVQFRFFHRLDDVEVSGDGTALEVLHLTRQARVEGAYEPLVTHGGLRVWTSEPDWSQLEQGEALRARGVDFESRFSPPATDEPVVLQRGLDFDQVVMALPAGVLAPRPGRRSPIRPWLDHAPHLERALGAMNLQASAAAQLWLDRPLSDAGWSRPPSVIGWTPPLSIFCDMSPVIDDEDWPEPAPRSSVYLCGVWSHPATEAPSSDREAPRRAGAEAEAVLDALWEASGDSIAPGARVTSRYVRANIEPTDLCDGAAPGTARLRPEAHESGLDNVVLASTWVRTGINSTCVEAAAMSGMAAARALGVDGIHIVGEDFLARPSSKARLADVRVEVGEPH